MTSTEITAITSEFAAASSAYETARQGVLNAKADFGPLSLAEAIAIERNASERFHNAELAMMNVERLPAVRSY